jgi:putative membrane protein
MKRFIRSYTGVTTIVLTLAGYVLVLGSLYLPSFSVLYPDIGLDTVNVLSHLIAGNNLVAMSCLIIGWIYIRNGDTQRHPKWMTAGFLLIMVFLVMYLVKTGGGGRKEFVGPGGARMVYLVMLAVHILLSIFSVPLVLYTLLLGVSNSIPNIPSTPHPRIGRYAAGAWIISLFLGLVAYVMLNHMYAFEFVAR